MNLLLEDRHDMFVQTSIKVNPTNKVSLAMKFICGYKQSEQKQLRRCENCKDHCERDSLSG